MTLLLNHFFPCCSLEQLGQEITWYRWLPGNPQGLHPVQLSWSLPLVKGAFFWRKVLFLWRKSPWSAVRSSNIHDSAVLIQTVLRRSRWALGKDIFAYISLRQKYLKTWAMCFFLMFPDLQLRPVFSIMSNLTEL